MDGKARFKVVVTFNEGDMTLISNTTRDGATRTHLGALSVAQIMNRRVGKRHPKYVRKIETLPDERGTS